MHTFRQIWYIFIKEKNVILNKTRHLRHETGIAMLRLTEPHSFKCQFQKNLKKKKNFFFGHKINNCMVSIFLEEKKLVLFVTDAVAK